MGSGLDMGYWLGPLETLLALDMAQSFEIHVQPVYWLAFDTRH